MKTKIDKTKVTIELHTIHEVKELQRALRLREAKSLPLDGNINELFEDLEHELGEAFSTE